MKEGLAQPAPFFRLPFIFSFNDYWKDTFKKSFSVSVRSHWAL
ncbi:hypothetical protein PAECIP111890_00297 [Paenibacillus sp. JJ-223]|nr:hypothetical protein PAECIP111890_00297 [Paenibacillus sp. JJ-223]